MENLHKIIFEHQNNENNEYELESAWATKIGNHYKLDNILFYAPEYSLGDIVGVEERSGELYVTGLIEASGHSTVRILFNNVDDVQPTRKVLQEMGADSEISNIPILISVDIPPNVSYSKIKEFLDQGENDSRWGYEEACIAHEN